jgi:hypothetical protein
MFVKVFGKSDVSKNEFYSILSSFYFKLWIRDIKKFISNNFLNFKTETTE